MKKPSANKKSKSGIFLATVIIIFLLAIIIMQVNKKQKELGAIRKRISQKKCKEAFEILSQIQEALNDKKERLSIAETAWLKAINEL